MSKKVQLDLFFFFSSTSAFLDSGVTEERIIWGERMSMIVESFFFFSL